MGRLSRFEARKSAQRQPVTQASEGKRAPTVEPPERSIERAQAVVDGIIHDVSNQVLSHELYGESTGQSMRIEHKDAIRSACRKRMQDVDGAVLSYIDALLSSDTVMQQHLMARLLVAVRDELLELASEQMSPEVRVVDIACKAPTEDLRERIAHTAVRSCHAAASWYTNPHPKHALMKPISNEML